MKKKPFPWRTVICSILIVPLFIFAGFSAVFFDHGANSVYAQQDWDAEQQATADETFAFLNFQEANLAAYTEREVSHLADVKVLFRNAYIAFTIFFLFLVIFLWTAKKSEFQNILFYGGMGTLGVILLLGILSLFDFTWFWTQFHYLLFPQGNWAFSADSMLIQLFPQQFFFNFAVSTILAIGSYGLIALFIGFVWKRRF